MAARELHFDDAGRFAFLAGVEKLSKAVATSFGPSGQKNGVTVPEDVELEDPYEVMGARLVRDLASTTVDIAGDGTTTAPVLAASICGQVFESMTAGAKPNLDSARHQQSR